MLTSLAGFETEVYHVEVTHRPARNVMKRGQPMEKRRLGRTGHWSTVVTFGAYSMALD